MSNMLPGSDYEAPEVINPEILYNGSDVTPNDPVDFTAYAHEDILTGAVVGIVDDGGDDDGKVGKYKNCKLTANALVGAVEAEIDFPEQFSIGDTGIQIGTEAGKTLSDVDVTLKKVTFLPALIGQQNSGVAIKASNGLELAEGIAYTDAYGKTLGKDVHIGLYASAAVKQGMVKGFSDQAKVDLNARVSDKLERISFM